MPSEQQFLIINPLKLDKAQISKVNEAIDKNVHLVTRGHQGGENSRKIIAAYNGVGQPADALENLLENLKGTDIELERKYYESPEDLPGRLHVVLKPAAGAAKK